MVCWNAAHSLDYSLNGKYSIQDALRAFLSPIKNDDTRLDFYTMYRKEATEYDTDYIKKYDDDLNTTLIFVRLSRLPFSPATHLTRSRRRVYSLLLVRPSSSMSNRSLNPIRTNSQQLSSAQSSSPSINLPSRTKAPLFPPFTKMPPARLPPHRVSCTQASWCRSWQHSSRCWGSSGPTVTCGIRAGR